MSSKIHDALAASRILGRLSHLSLEKLVNAGSTSALDPGEVLCRRGDPGDAVFVILEGEIEIRTTSADGRDVRYASFGPTAVVGEMATLDGRERSTDMVAVRRSRLWRIPRATLLEALHADPAAAVALVADLAGRLRAANTALEAMRTLDLAGRLAQFLLGTMGEQALVPLTQVEIARRLGVSREKVNRKLNTWVQQGWITLEASGIRVQERPALSSLLVSHEHS